MYFTFYCFSFSIPHLQACLRKVLLFLRKVSKKSSVNKVYLFPVCAMCCAPNVCSHRPDDFGKLCNGVFAWLSTAPRLATVLRPMYGSLGCVTAFPYFSLQRKCPQTHRQWLRFLLVRQSRRYYFYFLLASGNGTWSQCAYHFDRKRGRYIPGEARGQARGAEAI